MAPTPTERVEPAEAERLRSLGFVPGHPIVRFPTEAFGYHVTSVSDILRRTTASQSDCVVISYPSHAGPVETPVRLLMVPTSMVAVSAFESHNPSQRREYPDWYFGGFITDPNRPGPIADEGRPSAHLLLRRSGDEGEWLFQTTASTADEDSDDLVYLGDGAPLELRA